MGRSQLRGGIFSRCSSCSCALLPRHNNACCCLGEFIEVTMKDTSAPFFIVSVAGSPLRLWFDGHIGSACITLSPIIGTESLPFPVCSFAPRIVTCVKFKFTIKLLYTLSPYLMPSWQVVPAVKPKVAISDNLGFGGHNAALTFKVL